MKQSMLKVWLYFWFWAFLLISCKSKHETVVNNSPSNTAPIQKSAADPGEKAKKNPGKTSISKKNPGPGLAFDSFSEFPEAIDGCSCYFGRNKKEFSQQQYIYVNDFSTTSFISVNGKMINLAHKLLKDSTRGITYFAQNKDYEITVKVKSRVPAGEEVDWLTGEIILKDNKRNKIIKTDFAGECGC